MHTGEYNEHVYILSMCQKTMSVALSLVFIIQKLKITSSDPSLHELQGLWDYTKASQTKPGSSSSQFWSLLLNAELQLNLMKLCPFFSGEQIIPNKDFNQISKTIKVTILSCYTYNVLASIQFLAVLQNWRTPTHTQTDSICAVDRMLLTAMGQIFCQLWILHKWHLWLFWK